VTKKCYQDTVDRPQIEVKSPRDQAGFKKLELNVRPHSNSMNTIDDWHFLIKIRYVDESQ
jgi:hypothetical protein